MDRNNAGDSIRSIKKGSQKGTVDRRRIVITAVVVSIAIVAVAWYVLVAANNPSGPEIVRVDGSSTVFPITSAWATEFNNEKRQVVVAFSGTGGGFQKFCRGETQLSDASRPIKQSELDMCTQNGISGVTEFKIAYDGISVVVPIGNTWVQHLTVKQLCRIWTSNESAGACGGEGPRVTKWSELNSSWPDQTIRLFGPGTDSGTFDYFKEVILTPTKDPITDQFFPSEDDNVLVQAISNEPNYLGYFGYAYVHENTDKIRAVAIDDEKNGDGPVMPTSETIKDGSYAPLSRPLFVYASAKSLESQVVKDFLRFGYSARGHDLINLTGYVPLDQTEMTAQLAKIPG